MEHAEIKTLFAVFDSIVNLCLNPNWPNNNVDSQELVTIFQNVNYMETCISRLRYLNIINDFVSSFEVWQKKSRNNSSQFINIFINAKNVILMKLMYSGLDSNKLDIAMTKYMNIFGESDLEQQLAIIMLKTSSNKFILDHFAASRPDDKILNQIKLEVMLSVCNKNQNNLNDNLLDIINTCDENILVQIVSSISFSSSMNLPVQLRIKSTLLDIMTNEGHTYAGFWKILLTRVDKEVLVKLCVEHFEIFKSIVKYLIYCSKYMREVEIDDGGILWENDTMQSPCPDLLFNQFSDIVRYLYSNSALRKYLLDSTIYVKQPSNFSRVWNYLLKLE